MTYQLRGYLKCFRLFITWYNQVEFQKKEVTLFLFYISSLLLFLFFFPALPTF